MKLLSKDKNLGATELDSSQIASALSRFSFWQPAQPKRPSHMHAFIHVDCTSLSAVDQC